MKYLIFLILGPLLIFIGRKTRSRILEKRSKGYAAMLILSFLWLSVQVAGVMYEMLKVQYDVSPGLTPFNFFDHTTWNGPQWLYMVGLGVYFLALLILSLYCRWPSYLLILLGIAMLEYDVLAFIVGVILTSDYFLIAIPAIFLKMILEMYLGFMAYISIFGVFTFIMPFKDYQGAQVSRGGSDGGSGQTAAGSSRMPSSIHSADGTTYYLRQNLGYGAEYVASDDPDDVIQITNVYSRTGSEMDTNAGHFYFY
ncbi:MAG TPA: hypothetical protein IAC82_09740 [Candidatus Merdivicinus intestinigallinarum]|nr:hypothetical protein [Candidatus Merdivicinus intestinigallinarum]